MEALEYQAPNAQELVTAAIGKLPLIADYQEAESYTQRLNAAITRISTLPTAEEWQKTEAARQAAKAQEQQALQQQISLQQQRLEATLNREQLKWNTGAGNANGPSAVITAGKED